MEEAIALELSKQQTARVIAERDALLNRSPQLATAFPLAPSSRHPSEHSLTATEKFNAKLQRDAQKQNKKQENAQLKLDTIVYYYGQQQVGTLTCMATNQPFQISTVHRSHIFQYSWDENKLDELILAGGFEFADQEFTKDSPENMLLLHDHVETKYDCGQLLFEYQDSDQKYICRVLDKSIENDIVFLHPLPLTFGQLDGKELHFPGDSRPLRRLIRFRAIVNRLVAIDRGYIEPNELQHLIILDDWSPGSKSLFDTVIDWSSKIPNDSHLYVDTAAKPV